MKTVSFFLLQTKTQKYHIYPVISWIAVKKKIEVPTTWASSLLVINNHRLMEPQSRLSSSLGVSLDCGGHQKGLQVLPVGLFPTELLMVVHIWLTDAPKKTLQRMITPDERKGRPTEHWAAERAAWKMRINSTSVLHHVYLNLWVRCAGFKFKVLKFPGTHKTHVKEPINDSNWVFIFTCWRQPWLANIDGVTFS